MLDVELSDVAERTLAIFIFKVESHVSPKFNKNIGMAICLMFKRIEFMIAPT